MRNKIKYILGLLLIICAVQLPNNAVAQIKKGTKLYQEGRYAEAIRPLKRDFEGKNNDQEAGILLAKCYYQLLDYQEALDVISIVGMVNLSTFEDRRFYADVLIANDNFSEAYLELIQLLSEDLNDPKSNLWLDKVGDLMAWDSIETVSSFRELNGINSVFNEYAPYASESGEIWFVNDHTNIQAVFPTSYNNQNMHLYYKTKMSVNGSNRVNKPSMLIKNKDYYYHDGPLDEWTGHNKYALTLRDLDGPINGGYLGIYFSEMTGSEDDVIAFKHNGKFNTAHPTFTRNGSRLIFASDRPGGYGQMDLWYSDWREGTWTAPRNMGPVINTPYNEVFPNQANDRLFFSSNRLDKGYGGLDLYYSSSSLGYGEVYNLRTPLNGPYDDFGTSFKNSIDGYFVSNRPGGSGGDDIYLFSFIPEQLNIPTRMFKIIDSKVANNTEIKVYDSSGELIATTTVGSDGLFNLENLKTREPYTVKVGGSGVAESALLQVISDDGDLYATYPLSEDDIFRFELLPSHLNGMKRKNMVDDSELNFAIDGKVIAEDSVDIEGIPVSLLDQFGTVIATVKTTQQGAFSIDGAKIGENYTLKTEGLDDYHEIDIFGKSGAITQSLTPMGNNQFSYMRAAPAAAWMASGGVVVPAVFAVVLDNEPAANETVILFNEQDSILSNPVVDEDGFVSLGSLMAGNAYRLNLPQRNLTRDNRLVILDGNGDTSQTVRPFDATNYFFEYLLYSDYGAFDDGTPAIAAATVSESSTSSNVLKMRIDDFKPEDPMAFVLLSEEGELVSDTMYINPSGVAVIRDIDPGLNYELALIDSAFGEPKNLEIYNESNKKIFVGPTRADSTALLLLAPEVPADTLQESLLSIGFSGKIDMNDSQSVKMEVFDSQRVKLAETYVSEDQKFSFKDLKPDEQYIVKLDKSSSESILKVHNADSEDSLTVVRRADEYFYVNFTGEVLTLIDNNQEEVKVKAGTKFELENIYYDFNSFIPKTSSEPSMDKLATVMKNNPNLHIEIQSHTDARGPRNYNALLSQKRAGGVVDYLVSKGISESRLKAVGMGEEQLTNKCANGVWCPNSEHAKNRRTEFVILGNQE